MMRKVNFSVLVLTAAILVFMTGCGIMKDKVNEKIGEGIAEKVVGGKVDISKDGGVKVQKDGSSFEGGTDLKWPQSSMGDLPEPKAKISGVVTGKEGSSIVFSEMSLGDAQAYIEKLKELGYKDGLNMTDSDSLSYTGKNSSGATVMFAYNASPKEGTIGYSSAEANQSMQENQDNK